MGYSIVMDKKFVKTAMGILPIVLVAESNCFQSGLNGRDKRARSWSTFNYTKFPTTGEILMRAVEDTLPSTYGEHFKYNGKWVDDKGLVNFFESGIRNALTLEEMTAKYNVYGLTVEVMAKDLESTKEWASSKSIIRRHCRTNAELDAAMEEAVAACKAQPEEAYPYLRYDFGTDDRLETKRKTRRSHGYNIKSEMGYVLLLSNGEYFKKRSSRHIWYTDAVSFARVFRSPQEAERYAREELYGFSIASEADVMRKALVICTRRRERYWAGRDFVEGNTFAKTYNTQMQADKALAEAVLVDADARIVTETYLVSKVARESAAAANA